MFFQGKKSPHAPGCMALQLVTASFLFLAVIASLVGVYKAHFMPDGLVFGTSTGSLSLIALAMTITFFMQQLKSCMMKCEVCK